MEQVLDLQSLVKAHFISRLSDDDEPIYILLHGYCENAQKMWRRFSQLFSEEINLLALNGPYPIPVKKDDGYEIGYSWFFFDPETGQYYIHYDVVVDYFKNFAKALNIENRDLRLIGFSQGGYCLPHLAQAHQNVTKCISLGAQLVIESPQFTQKNLKFYSLHGSADESVDIDRAQTLFNTLPDAVKGEFISYEGLTHKPSLVMLKKAVELAIRTQ